MNSFVMDLTFAFFVVVFVRRGGSRVFGVRGVDWRGLVIQCFNQRERRRSKNKGEERRERKT